MPQDEASGRAAVHYGRSMAQRVAQFLGAKLLSEFSNEAFLNDEPIVIKSAHQRTPEIGVSQAMLERVQTIVAALENPDRTYTIYGLNPEWYQRHMLPSRSRSPHAQKIMMVKCRPIRREGRVIGIMPG